MQLDDLPSPGYVSNGTTLLKEAYKAIQYARVQADVVPGTDTGAVLRNFFLACAEKCPVPVEAPKAEETVK
jgi:hypothetical protein